MLGFELAENGISSDFTEGLTEGRVSSVEAFGSSWTDVVALDEVLRLCLLLLGSEFDDFMRSV